MSLLVALLALDALLHSLVIYRFGVSDNANLPFLVFAVIDAALAIAVFLALSYAVWSTLALSAFGLVGLTVTFKNPQRDRTLDKAIWAVDAAIVLCAAWLLFLAD